MTALSAIEANLDGDLAPGPGAGALRINVFGPQGETIQTLDLADGVTTIGQAPANQLVLAGPEVGRYHLRVTRAAERVSVADLGSRSGTLLGERRLPAQTEQDWPVDTVLRLGAFRLRLERPSQIGGGTSAPALAAAPPASQVEVRFDAGRETLELTPGQAALVMVALSNRGDEPATPLLSVEGLPASWVRLPEQALVIPPRGAINALVHVLVPHAPESRAGEYQVVIRARLERNLAESSVASARWTVLPFYGSAIEMRPPKRAVRGRRQTFYTLSLSNTGNQPASYAIRSGDDEPALDYLLDQTRMTLEPGASASLRLTVQPRENPAGRSQNYTFNVQAAPSGSPPISATGQLSQTAPFPAWLLPVLLLGLLLPLLLIGWWALQNDQAVAAAAPTQAQASPTTTTTPAPTPTLDLADAVVAPPPTPDVEALVGGTQTAIAAAAGQAATAAAQAQTAAAPNPTAQALDQAYQLVQTQLAEALQAKAAGGSGGSGSGGSGGSGSGGSGGSGSGGSGSGGSSGSGSGGSSSASSSGGSGSGGSGSGGSGSGGSSSAATATPTATPTSTATGTLTATATGTATSTPTNTPTPTKTSTPTSSPTPSNTPTSTPLPAARLSFYRQPGSSTGGALLAQQPIVQVEDSAGGVVTGFVGQVTIAIQNDACQPAPRAPALAGARTVAVLNGQASFTDLAIDCAGAGYTLQATINGLPSAVSQPFNVNVGPAHHLLFISSPNDARAGATLAPSPLVRVVDLGENRVSTFTSSIRVSITGGTGTSGASLSGTTGQRPASGDSTYANLSVNRVGVNYTLTATSGALAGVSNPFDITADRLTFASAPGNTRANDNLGAIVVQATDAAGTIDTTFTGNIALTLTGGNPSGAVSNGATSAPASGGVATFSSALRIGQVGSGYQLQADSGALTGLSGAFNITADRLIFISSPGNTRVNSNLGAIRVQATDGFGNPDPTFAGSVALTLTSGTAGARLRNAPTTVTASGGVADFGASLRIDRVGQAYQIQASSGGLAVDSAAFNITADRLSFFSAPSTTRANGDLGAVEVRATDGLGNIDPSFSATISLALSGGNPLGQLYNSPIGVTASAGVASFATSLRINHLGQSYRLLASGGGLSATSGAFDITADRLQFVAWPGSAAANSPFATQPKVVATDGFGNIDSFTSYSVTLELTGGTAGARLLPSPNITVSTSGGVASFSNLRVDTAGSNYQLRATSGTLTSDVNPPALFNITP